MHTLSPQSVLLLAGLVLAGLVGRGEVSEGDIEQKTTAILDFDNLEIIACFQIKNTLHPHTL